MMHRIVVCSTCECTDGKGFAARLRAAFSERGMEFTVQDHDCMSNCGRPLSVAFSAAGKATYLFGDIDPTIDLEDTLAFAALYAACADGWIEDARPAGRLRHCLIGRVPS
jgi:predicted metal-binding protein